MHQPTDREYRIDSRRRSQQGWSFGWDAFSLKDQFAHLGEIVSEAAYLEESKGQSPHGDEMLLELEGEIRRDAAELKHAAALLGGDDTLTPVLLREVERAWKADQAAKMADRFIDEPDAIPTFFSERGAESFAAYLASRDDSGGSYLVMPHPATESMPKPTWTIEYSQS